MGVPVILKSGGRDVEVKSSILDEAWPFGAVPPEIYSGSFLAGASGGNPAYPFQSIDQAMGLPALLGILLRLSTAVGMLPQKVYEGIDQLDRTVATDSWQYELLHERPTVSGEHTPFTLRADIAMAVAGYGYCPIRMYSARGKVVELLPQDPRRITPRRINGKLVFEDRTEGQAITRDASEILYVRAPATNGGVQGIAPITLLRMGISTGLKRAIFEGGYYDKSAEPRVVLSFPEEVNAPEAKEWKELWNDDHQGLENMHSTSVIGGGATVTTIPISLADAQFVESTRGTTDQLGFVYGIPKAFLNTADRQTVTDSDWRYFTTFGLSWITTAIDQAFTANPILFPRGQQLRAETLIDALLKPDILTRYQAYAAARQAGWLAANEIRALENYPPIAGGDVLQVTPVGGAVDNTGATAEGAAKALQLLAAEYKTAPAEEREIIERIFDRARRSGLLAFLPA
jgi:HK97 family phage portal protein